MYISKQKVLYVRYLVVVRWGGGGNFMYIKTNPWTDVKETISINLKHFNFLTHYCYYLTLLPEQSQCLSTGIISIIYDLVACEN